MEQKHYTLPLAPQDLVAIYKEKDETDSGEEFCLYVDYDKTTEKLSDQHILIYLANTNFKTTFDKITPTLLVEFIKSNFLVNAPILARVLTIVLRKYLKYELTPPEAILSSLVFDEKQIDEFIELNGNLLEDLITSIQETFAFVLYKINEITEEGKEPELESLVKEIEITDTASNVGPNIARLVTEAVDAMYLVFHVRGITQSFNKQVFNDNPKFYGKDLMFIFTQTGITGEIVKMLPEGFWHDSNTK
jgi:hypothetical protein|tara:strand:+ start:724 stop:1467 length:744 start_codon:yes stop_codon:yes gene_type:complete